MKSTKKELQRVVAEKLNVYADDLFFGEELQNINERLNSLYSSIVVVGQFSVGKSALLNALLGDELLSTRRIESTKVLTRIRYCAPSQEPSIVLQFQNGISKEIPVNNLADLEQYTTFQGTDITDELRFVDVFWPLSILDEQLILIDTPGANSLTSTAFKITEEALREASAVIYLFNGQKGIDQTDDQLLKSLVEKQKRIFLVATHVDDLTSDDWELVQSSVLKKLGEHVQGLENTKIYPVSSIKALKGKRLENKELFAESNFGVLEADLFDYMDSREYEAATLNSISFDLTMLLNEIANAEEAQQILDSEAAKERKQRLERLIAVTRHQYQEVLLQGEKLLKERFRRLEGQLDCFDEPLNDLKTEMKKRIQGEFREFRKVVLEKMNLILLDVSPLEQAFTLYERQAELSYRIWEERVQTISEQYQENIVETVSAEDEAFVAVLENMNTNVSIRWAEFKQQLIPLKLKSVDLNLEQDSLGSYQEALRSIEDKYKKANKGKIQTQKNNEQAWQSYEWEMQSIHEEEQQALKNLGDMPSVEYRTETERKFLLFKKTIEYQDDSKQKVWKETVRDIKEYYRSQLNHHQEALPSIIHQTQEAERKAAQAYEQVVFEEETVREQFMASIVETLNNNSTHVLQTYRYFEEELDSEWKLHKQHYLERCEQHIDQVGKVFKEFVLQAEENQVKALYVN